LYYWRNPTRCSIFLVIYYLRAKRNDTYLTESEIESEYKKQLKENENERTDAIKHAKLGLDKLNKNETYLKIELEKAKKENEKNKRALNETENSHSSLISKSKQRINLLSEKSKAVNKALQKNFGASLSESD
jgi:hypothetical protein